MNKNQYKINVNGSQWVVLTEVTFALIARHTIRHDDTEGIWIFDVFIFSKRMVNT